MCGAAQAARGYRRYGLRTDSPAEVDHDCGTSALRRSDRVRRCARRIGGGDHERGVTRIASASAVSFVPVVRLQRVGSAVARGRLRRARSRFRARGRDERAARSPLGRRSVESWRKPWRTTALLTQTVEPSSFGTGDDVPAVSSSCCGAKPRDFLEGEGPPYGRPLAVKVSLQTAPAPLSLGAEVLCGPLTRRPAGRAP